MINPNKIGNSPSGETAHEPDLEELDNEMEQHLAQSAPELIEPFGSREMITIDTDRAIGALACVNMLNTSVDDMPGGPNPDGTIMMQDPGVELESYKSNPDVSSLS